MYWASVIMIAQKMPRRCSSRSSTLGWALAASPAESFVAANAASLGLLRQHKHAPASSACTAVALIIPQGAGCDAMDVDEGPLHAPVKPLAPRRSQPLLHVQQQPTRPRLSRRPAWARPSPRIHPCKLISVVTTKSISLVLLSDRVTKPGPRGPLAAQRPQRPVVINHRIPPRR